MVVRLSVEMFFYVIYAVPQRNAVRVILRAYLVMAVRRYMLSHW